MTTVAQMIKSEKRTTGERKAKTLQEKSRGMQVERIGRSTFRVLSTSGKTYIATVNETQDFTSCTCDWAQYRPSGSNCGCSHVVAAINHIAGEQGKTASAWGSREDAERQHKHIWNLGDGMLVTIS